MTIFIQNDATGGGAGNLDPNQGFGDLMVAANGDTGLGLAAQVGNRQQVTYAQTLFGNAPNRLNNLINNSFTPDYGDGPQTVDIIILPVGNNFALNDGTLITTIAGTALSPQGSGEAGAANNMTDDCLVIYDTSNNNGDGYCVARAGTGGTLDLPFPSPALLYHELSHAFRILNNNLLALGGGCNPSSPEENAAIVDENDVRTQIANALGETPELRDPGIHCGGSCGGNGGSCCIVASVASGSPVSAEVSALRKLRDGFLRKSEVGFAFFHALHFDYYAFSPQVTRLMARYPGLQSLVLDNFVRPFVKILGLVQQYALGGADADALGEQFALDHVDQEQDVVQLDMFAQANDVLDGKDDAPTDMQLELEHLLLPALESEHLRWAVVDLLQIYRSALEAYHNGHETGPLGEQLYEQIGVWATRIPIDDVWGSLSAAELRTELDMVESLFLRSEEAKGIFRDRLRQKFGTVTAVTRVLDEKLSANGENK